MRAAVLALALSAALVPATVLPSAARAADGAGLPATSPANVPEPEGLWRGSLRGYTPASLRGAIVIDAEGLERLMADADPVLIDVGPADRKPPSMAENAPWMPAHRSIPGAVWMPGAGSGVDDEKFSAAFRDRVAQLTDDDLDRPIVTFCHPECWGSWNAGKRLLGLGYRKVFWFRDGVEGWQAGREPVTVKADPLWAPAAPADQPL